MTTKALKQTGRPTKFTPGTLAKLEEAYSMGCSDREACLLADISPSALYRYQERHPEFSERKKTLQKAMTVKARRVLQRDIENGDSVAARWYLERKEKNEFSAKADLDVNNRVEHCMTIEERGEAIGKFLQQYQKSGE